MRTRTILPRSRGVKPPDNAIVFGAHDVLVDATSVIEPQVVFDATAGPIYVGPDTSVRAFTRIIGPCFIGGHTQILGGEMSSSEQEAVVFLAEVRAQEDPEAEAMREALWDIDEFAESR